MRPADLLILAGGIAALWFTDVGSESTFRSVILPVVDVVFLIYLCLRIVLIMHGRGISQTTSNRGGLGGGGFDGGGGDG